MTNITELWEELDSRKKTSLIRMGTICITVLVILAFYFASGRDEVEPVAVTVEKDISLNTNLLEDDIKQHVDEKIADSMIIDGEQDEGIKELQREVARLKIALDSKPSIETPPDKGTLDLSDLATSFTNTDQPKYPPPPASTIEAQNFNVEGIEPVFIGEIGHTAGVKFEKNDTKKKKRVRLPPSFMEGTLLTGIDLDAIGGATGEPEPLVFQVDALSVLPNSLKADLEGCFIVANATGKINKERIESRLVSVDCLSKDGKIAVHGELHGYVSDQDGKKGLKGIVSSKAGSLIYRAAVASAISELGGVFSQTATSTSVVGSTSIIETNSEDITNAAIGGMFKGGADQITEILVEYIKNTTPVISAGTNKKVTMVITKASYLDIFDPTAEEFTE